MVRLAMPDGRLSPLVCIGKGWDGRPCQFAPVPGNRYCEMHWGHPGSQAVRHLDRASRKLTGKGALDLMKPGAVASMKFGAPIETDPGVALLNEVFRTAGHVAWLEEKIRDLEESELVWGTVMMVREERSGGQGGDYVLERTENKSVINTWWELYRKEREHLAKVSAAAIRAGIEERRVRIAERGVDALEMALSAALADLGLDPADERVRSIVGRRLSEVVAADIFGHDREAEHATRVVQGEVVMPQEVVPPRRPTPRRPAAPLPPGAPQPVEW